MLILRTINYILFVISIFSITGCLEKANKTDEASLASVPGCYSNGNSAEKNPHCQVTTTTTTTLPATSGFQTIDSYAPIASGFTSTGTAIAADSTGILYVAGFDTSGSYQWIVRKSSDNGISWITADQYQLPGGTSTIANAVTVDSTGAVYVGGYACASPSNGGCNGLIGLVRKSTDQGGTWTTVDTFPIVPTGMSGGWNFGVLSLTVDTSDRIYMAGCNGTWLIRMSSDGGASWNTLDSGAVGLATAITIGPSGSIYAAGSRKVSGVWQWQVRQSQDSGITWTILDTYTYGVSFSAFPTSIAIDSSENIYVTGFQGILGSFSDAGYGSTWITRKRSGGNWMNVDSETVHTFLSSDHIDSRPMAITTDADGSVYAAGLIGSNWTVKVSQDGGASWSVIDNFHGAWGPRGMTSTSNGVYVTGGASGEIRTRMLAN